MAALNGIFADSPVVIAALAPFAGGAYSAPPFSTPVVGPTAITGAKTFTLAGLGYSPSAKSAQRGPFYGGELWEKVIVNPRTKALGFVLSTITFQVDVWNTDRFRIVTLNSVAITGGGNTTTSGGPATPAPFGPLQNYVYTVSVPQDGPATILDTVTWNFVGPYGPILGADIVVSGQRITVFSVEIDWSNGFRESQAYLTDILTAYTGKEQRIQLRQAPRYSTSFNVVAVQPEEGAYLEALLFSWQSRLYGVPWWPDAMILQADVNAGGNVLSVPDISQRYAFQNGGLVMVWRDWYTWEALTISALSSTTVTLLAPLTKNWKAGDLVVPLKRGRLADSVELQSPSSVVRTFTAAFDCEVV